MSFSLDMSSIISLMESDTYSDLKDNNATI